MKKLVIAISLFVSTNAYAGLIDLPSYISGNDVSISNMNTTNTTIENWANGNVEGGTNIKPGSLVSQDFASSVSIITYRDEAFSDFTYTGMLPVTDSDLTSDISAGTSYVDGYRIVTSATAHTYTASKDTYVYIHQGGYFVYQEVANGAAAPSTPTNTLLLAKVVTSAGAITSIADLRTTSIQITASSSNFPTNHRDQATVSRDTTTNFFVSPGSIALGSSNYTNTVATSTKSIITGTNWIEGSYPSGYSGLVFVYGYNNSGSAFDFKFSSADVAYSDTSANTAGVKRYYSSGGTYYRAIGWAYLSADAVQPYQTSNHRDNGTYNSVEYSSTTSVNTGSSSFVNDGGLPMLRFYSSGGRVRITYSAACANSGSQSTTIGIMIDNSDITETARESYTNNTTTQAFGVTTQWQGVLTRGIHSIQGRFKTPGSTGYINSRSIIVEEI